MLRSKSPVLFNFSVFCLSSVEILLKNSVRTVPVLSPSMRLSLPSVSVLHK